MNRANSVSIGNINNPRSF